ncbi:MAG: S9 family peptidase [Sphingomonadaceae bacterium]|nr:S9 family peptidase [Altererythrobacter sp.]MCP5391387.1 S9 family peptidase [Sphingomonadaceae bacterium]MCP5393616.1 S9 family peptidase [Sphingomonadaceae bacterium]
MKFFKSSLVAAMVGLTAVAVPASTVGAQTTERVPIPVWSLRDVISAVSLSPDGKHILVLKTESKEGDYLLEIYETADMSKPLRRLNADPMEIISARWVNDNYIFGTAWQVKRSSVKGPEEDVREYATYSYNLEKNKFSKVDGNFNIVNNLPKEPNKVLVASGRENDGGSGVDPFAAFRPRSYYRYDLESGARELILKGSEKYPTATFDNDGNPRYTSSVDRSTNELKQYYRLPGDGSWKEFGERYDFDEYENLYRVLGGFMGVVGFDDKDPTIGYVIDNRGEDKAALWEFDFKTGEFGEKIYQNPDADVINVQTSSMGWAGDNHIVAAIFPGAKYERAWFDTEEKALYDALEKQIPYAHQVAIAGRSRDGKTMVVTNRGPHDPGSFWLIKDGKRAKLGSRNPLLKPEQLADVEFIKYPARDGRMIPAYVTKPKGEGPFPLIVLPHGGPHVNEVISYDEWGQLLANNGYMVLQPQYRMSVGWGQDHFDSAYGQHGLAMQDDKDDGALYLVKQGLVDPDRMAMFGWSYGGYAALVATTRDPQIYQCAIAGAAVADPAKVYRLRRSPDSPKALDDWSQRRGMIGINPINEVEKSNIPLLMVHGDVDSRVLYFNYKDYKAAMEKAGKTNAQYLTLKGADHFYRTLMYNHQEAFFTKMLDFLKNDCGPGGL